MVLIFESCRTKMFYYTREKRPRVLTCGHSFCKPCILEASTVIRRESSGLIRSINCSECRALSEFSESKIPINYELSTLIGELNLDVPLVSCTECEDWTRTTSICICTTCTSIAHNNTAADIRNKRIDIRSILKCSACILRHHASDGHSFFWAHTLILAVDQELTELTLRNHPEIASSAQKMSSHHCKSLHGILCNVKHKKFAKEIERLMPKFKRANHGKYQFNGPEDIILEEVRQLGANLRATGNLVLDFLIVTKTRMKFNTTHNSTNSYL
ncbi:hypothetical protein L3Y34_003708 [Caenorhabditis briggsae]|uniref:RING-type domain-containing protein n=1 Tax=Caenorhabditis briggsae TaxID=6238 RepID=A0AAE9D685_CAEBR|nr:hypothetical protein L3Y34_003708 [Caenorhabditis briggsae]